MNGIVLISVTGSDYSRTMTEAPQTTQLKPKTYQSDWAPTAASRTASRSLAASLIMALLATILIGVAPSKAANPIALADIYDNFSVTKVYLEVPPASETSLNTAKTFKTWVAAKVKFVNGDRESAQMSIGMRLKGSTSLQPLKAKPSMKLKFNWGASLSGARFLGLKNMTLHSMTQDSSLIHEVSSYRLFNAMGVVAPKTGWAEVFVNGVSKGIYANVETPDDVFLSTRFKDVTQHLYEGQAFNDLLPGKDNGGENDGAFLVDEGWNTTPNKNDLTKLIEVANITDPKKWWAEMAKYTDRDRLVTQFAVENILGGWDAYSGPIINNYFLRSNAAGKFTMMPWGVDQNFGENRDTPALLDEFTFPMDSVRAAYPWIKHTHKGQVDLPRGILFQKCIKYQPCRTLYLQKLKATSAKANSIKLTGFMTQVSAVIAPYSNDNAKAEQVRSISWFKKQQTAVTGLLKKYKIK